MSRLEILIFHSSSRQPMLQNSSAHFGEERGKYLLVITAIVQPPSGLARKVAGWVHSCLCLVSCCHFASLALCLGTLVRISGVSDTFLFSCPFQIDRQAETNTVFQVMLKCAKNASYCLNSVSL